MNLSSNSLRAIRRQLKRAPVDLPINRANWLEALRNMLSDDKRKHKSLIKLLSFMRHQASIELSSPDNISRPSTSYIQQEYGHYFRQRVFHKLFPPVKRGYGFNDIKVVSTHSIISVIDFVYKLINEFASEARQELMKIFKVTLGSLHDHFLCLLDASKWFLDYFKLKAAGLRPPSALGTAVPGSTAWTAVHPTS